MPRGHYVRKPRTPAPPPPASVPLPPKRRPVRHIGDQIAMSAATLTAREEALARKAKETAKLLLLIKLVDKDALLTMAEKYGDQLAEVARACLYHGMEHFNRVLLQEPPVSPFTRGSFNAPPLSRIDPSGTAWPPAPVPPVFDRPQQPFQNRWQDPPRSFVPQQAQHSTVETVDAVFARSQTVGRVAGKDVTLAGIIPSGATEEITRENGMDAATIYESGPAEPAVSDSATALMAGIQSQMDAGNAVNGALDLLSGVEDAP